MDTNKNMPAAPPAHYNRKNCLERHIKIGVDGEPVSIVANVLSGLNPAAAASEGSASSGAEKIREMFQSDMHCKPNKKVDGEHVFTPPESKFDPLLKCIAPLKDKTFEIDEISDKDVVFAQYSDTILVTMRGRCSARRAGAASDKSSCCFDLQMWSTRCRPTRDRWRSPRTVCFSRSSFTTTSRRRQKRRLVFMSQRQEVSLEQGDVVQVLVSNFCCCCLLLAVEAFRRRDA